MASTKRNFAYNLALTLSGYIFPLLTFPYVSRVLGASDIGICNFVGSVVNYFILFANLGIESYGIREIARYQDNEERKNEVFSNLFFINAVTTFFSLLVLIICTYTVPTLAAYKPFLKIGTLQLIFNLFLTNWFFQGISDFKYITIRAIAVKMIYVVSVFVFIHSTSDTLTYYFLTVFTIILTAIINWLHGRKFRKLSFSAIHPLRFLKPVLSFGFYKIVTSMYTSFNMVYLGFVASSAEVGYFTTATKLYSILMGVFSAFTTVMIPRVAKLLKDKEYEHLNTIATETFSLIIIFALPIIAFCELNAADIILILSGEGFEGAVIPFRIVIFLLLIIGSEQIIITQFLMASTSNKAIMSVGLIGVVIGLTANFSLTPSLGSTGSSIAWGASEIGVLLSGIILVGRVMNLRVDLRILVKKIFESIIFFIPFILLAFRTNHWTILVVSGVWIAASFVWLNMFHDKNKYVVEIWNKFFGKIIYVKIN